MKNKGWINLANKYREYNIYLADIKCDGHYCYVSFDYVKNGVLLHCMINATEYLKVNGLKVTTDEEIIDKILEDYLNIKMMK